MDQSLATVESRVSHEGSVMLWDVNLVEASGGHGLSLVVDVVLVEHVSALFGDSLLEVRVSLQSWHKTSILWNNTILSLNGLSLIAHVVVACSVHVARSPLEEVVLTNRLCFLMVAKIKLGFSFASQGVIQL